MRFYVLSISCLIALATATAIPSEELERRQSNFTPIDTSTLYLGACLSIGSCYYNGDQTGCYTPACGNSTKLGEICSCNVYVQAELDKQLQKGQKLWPVKCPY